MAKVCNALVFCTLSSFSVLAGGKANLAPVTTKWSETEAHLKVASRSGDPTSHFCFGIIALPRSMKGGWDGEFPEAKRKVTTTAAPWCQGRLWARIWEWPCRRGWLDRGGGRGEGRGGLGGNERKRRSTVTTDLASLPKGRNHGRLPKGGRGDGSVHYSDMSTPCSLGMFRSESWSEDADRGHG